MRASPAMLKAVVSACVVDCLPFWESALDYLECAVLDLEALRELVRAYGQTRDDWHKNLQNNGSIDYFPSVNVSYFGVQISGAAGLTLVIRSLVHNLHKSLDSLAQFVNAVALADEANDVGEVTIHNVKDKLRKVGGFDDLLDALQDLTLNQDFLYVVDLDNTLKHTVAIDPDIKWFFLSNTMDAYLPAFKNRRSKRQYLRKQLISTAEELVKFVSDKLKKFDQLVSVGCGVVWKPVTGSRLHDLSAYVQYDVSNRISGSIQYLRVSGTPRLGDTIKVLAVVTTVSDGMSNYTFLNSLSDTLVLRNQSCIPIGIAKAVEPVSTDELPLLEYREYNVTHVGAVTNVQLHQILEEPKQVVGQWEKVSGYSVGEFPSKLLTGEITAT